MIAIKIDVTLVTKSRLFPGANGAQYLDIVLIETPNGKYGNDFMAVEGVSKEERLAKVRGVILGNAKYLGSNRPAQQEEPAEHASPRRNRPTDEQLENRTPGKPDDGLPF